jgi:hypothetical protein
MNTTNGEEIFAALPTGRENIIGILSQDCATLRPGLFSSPPSGRVPGRRG